MPIRLAATAALTLLTLALAMPLCAQSLSFEALRTMADAAPDVASDKFVNDVPAFEGARMQRMVIEDDLYLDGIVTSIPDNHNMVVSMQVHYTRATATPTLIAAFMQSEDGRYGVRLDFQRRHMGDALTQFHHARISLKGLTLCKEACGYVLHGLTPDNVVEVSEFPCSEPPSKAKTIAQLSDEDLYTYVSLQDCEFVFKDGDYLNVYENYTKSPGPGVKGVRPNNMMDTWATALTDKDGGRCYLVMSSALDWRRSGNGVPQGSGIVRGILDRPSMPRYGNIHLCYGIHPLLKEDIVFDAKSPSNYTTLAEWNWDDGAASLRGDGHHIPADIGQGILSCDVTSAQLSRSNDFNNLVVYPDKTPGVNGTLGRVNYGALQISAKGSGWWNWQEDHGNALIVNVSTKGLTGHNLLLAFSFAGGRMYAKNSSYFPCWWCVEYSVDGKRFYKADQPDILLRSLTWGTQEHNLADDTYPTSEEAGLGMTEHLVRLPIFLFGRDRVTIRITPSRKVVSSLALRDQARGALTPSLNGTAYVHFGTVKLMYD